MGKNLVIVESPAKAKTIEKFLGKDFHVTSSFGHIRDLKKKDISIDFENNYQPIYEVPTDKKKVVAELKKKAKVAECVWLASDEDREGEAISWHLAEELKLKPENTKRIVFHEITKNAILNAIENPRELDVALVDAQQARRVLDRIVGFELSPILWRKIKPSLSAGRVQSVAVRLIVEREREINTFVSVSAYRVQALFIDETGVVLKAELPERFKTKEEAEAFLALCNVADFSVKDVTTKPLKRSPAPPFITSTLQQEAARKLGYSVSQTMVIAQRLYESGKITYMRTDSVNLSGLAIDTAKEAIIASYGEKYSKVRQFTKKAKGAQEAHEAIRPTLMSEHSIKGSNQEERLYSLIWKRAVASQMADAQLKKMTISIALSNSDKNFVATGETVVFDGFLKLYQESHENEDAEPSESSAMLPVLKAQDKLFYQEISCTERFTQRPPRFTEASLVRKMEELGIGRPSTYAPTITTIQNRAYIEKGEKDGVERAYNALFLVDGKISDENKTEIVGAERAKLFPTDTGAVVTDYLIENFDAVIDYNFTANLEKELDKVAAGDEEWKKTIDTFYKGFHPLIEESLEKKTERKVGERLLGEDPKTGKPISVKIGRYGAVAQKGAVSDEEKPQFASLKKGQSIETLSLEEAIELFKLPRVVGEFEEKEVKVAIGRFGPYIAHNGIFCSLPKEDDPLKVSLERTIELLEAKRVVDANRLVKKFEEDDDMQLLNGRYGVYLKKEKTNYKLPKGCVPEDLTYEECVEIIKNAPPKKARKKRK